ncbi:MAG: GNAT family N-acetyltransferase [Clostridia bacterium]|nr:GNAT family N-acetyltransferase [Clostridia bacterium]
MLRFRPYKPCDAKTIVSWIRNEYAFRQWCADRFDHYPLTADELNQHYEAQCMNDAFYPMCAYDDEGVQGHMILRFTDPEKKHLRFGFVIVNDQKRGTGLGKEMLNLAIRFGQDLLKAQTISLGVFENNPAAYHCYFSVGFRATELPEKEVYPVLGEIWPCIEMILNR